MARRPLLLALCVVMATGSVACSGDGEDTLDERVTLPAEVATAATDEPAAVSSGSSGPTSSTATLEATTTSVAATTSTTTATSTTALVTTTTLPNTPPPVDAAAYVVFDMRSGRQLGAANADQRLAVGSLMKLLATQVAYDAGEPTKIVTAPPDPLLLSIDESQIGIEPGQELPRDLLIRAMLKASANDAARLLAIDIAGSEAAYATLMNATAADLGLADTNAVNVTGLDAEGQYSSAADVTKLGVGLMGNITFQQTVKDPTAELNGQAVPNTNDLLTTYPGADGIKTGRTSGAGWCILASATRDNRRIVVAVLGAPDEDARNAAATALLDWGFTQP